LCFEPKRRTDCNTQALAPGSDGAEGKEDEEEEEEEEKEESTDGERGVKEGNFA